MTVDYHDQPIFNGVAACVKAWLRPGEKLAADLSQIECSPDGRHAAGSALVCETLVGVPSTCIAIVDLATGDLRLLTNGPGSDSAPKWSPDGKTNAYLSDREQAYVRQLRLLDPTTGEDRATPPVEGFVEYLQWCGDGRSILLGMASFGADLAGAQGGFSVSDAPPRERPSWASTVQGGAESAAWRSVWLYDATAGSARRVSPDGVNVWEAVCCGRGNIAAICSDSPDEGSWYRANLRLFALDGPAKVVFTPGDQLGWLSSSPSGRQLAVVEAVCSDRTLVAGDLRTIDLSTGAVIDAHTLDADVVSIAWRGKNHILFAAAKGPETIIGLHSPADGRSAEIWRSRERIPSGPIFPEVRPLGAHPGDCLFLREAYFEPPVLIALEDGQERQVLKLGSRELADEIVKLGMARDFAWTAPDGLGLHGWLLVPPRAGPHPLVMQIHGGPVWYYKPRYLGRAALDQALLNAGYALFLPNPRGSSGRGQTFARKVFGTWAEATPPTTSRGWTRWSSKGLSILSGLASWATAMAAT